MTDERPQSLLDLGRDLARAVNAYEAHTLEGMREEGRGIDVAPHTDAKRCSDRSEHRPWEEVVFAWPCYDRRASARAGIMTGAEVAVLTYGDWQVMVRYIATDHRWVVDERPVPAEAS